MKRIPVLKDLLLNKRGKLSEEIGMFDSKEIAILCARVADDKKAEDILIFDVRKLTRLLQISLLFALVLINGNCKVSQMIWT